MKQCFVVLAVLPVKAEPSRMNAQKVQFIGEFETQEQATEHIRGLLRETSNGAITPWMYWVQESFRAWDNSKKD